jgi:hypothetical protein
MRAEPYAKAGTTDEVAGYLIKGSRDEWDAVLRRLRPDEDEDHADLWYQISPHVTGHAKRKIQVWMSPETARMVFPLANIPSTPPATPKPSSSGTA